MGRSLQSSLALCVVVSWCGSARAGESGVEPAWYLRVANEVVDPETARAASSESLIARRDQAELTPWLSGDDCPTFAQAWFITRRRQSALAFAVTLAEGGDVRVDAFAGADRGPWGWNIRLQNAVDATAAFAPIAATLNVTSRW